MQGSMCLARVFGSCDGLRETHAACRKPSIKTEW